MDLFLLILSFLIMIAGIVGSVIPVLPGPLSSWLGLFMFSNISTVKVDSKILVFTLIIALTIFILDYKIPIYTSKKFGASKFGLLSINWYFNWIIFTPWNYIWGVDRSYCGELLLNKNFEKSIKAAAGVFLGLIVSGFTKALISIVFLVIYINLFLNNFSNLF